MQISRAPSLLIVRSGPSVIGRFRAMGTPCEVIVETGDDALGKEVARLVEGEARRIERKFSRYVKGNIIDRINAGTGEAVEVDAETAQLIDYADRCHRMSDGLFDITSGVLRRAWTFDGGDRVPPDAVVASLLPLVGWDKAAWDGRAIRLKPGMEIDLGGVGKEYAVDTALILARARARVPALVNFGGDIAAAGPRANGQPWTIGVENVRDPDAPPEDGAQAVLQLVDGAVTTSGDARKFVMRGGRRYGHILNPKTGFPVEDAPRSVTVVAKTCSEAGFLSTYGMLMGAGAEEFLKSVGARFICVRE